jgi:integrase
VVDIRNVQRKAAKLAQGRISRAKIVDACLTRCFRCNVVGKGAKPGLSIRPGFLGGEKTGEPIRGPRTWFESALKDAKIVGFHWHDLRHTFASRLRQKGAKIQEIAEALGPEYLMMSKPYAHLGPTGLHDVVALLQQKPTGPNLTPSRLVRELRFLKYVFSKTLGA